MKQLLIILVMAVVLVTSTFSDQVYAKHTHDASSNSTGGSSSSSLPSQLQPSASSGHTKPLTVRGNITSFMQECFTNNTGNAVNIMVNNASAIISHCLYQYRIEHIAHHPPAQQSPVLGSLLDPGQLIVTSVKNPSPKHTTAYNIGYKQGIADSKLGGLDLPNGLGACNPGIGINGTSATNQCLSGYFSAWNKYCPTSRYGCNS